MRVVKNGIGAQTFFMSVDTAPIVLVNTAASAVHLARMFTSIAYHAILEKMVNLKAFY